MSGGELFVAFRLVFIVGGIYYAFGCLYAMYLRRHHFLFIVIIAWLVGGVVQAVVGQMLQPYPKLEAQLTWQHWLLLFVWHMMLWTAGYWYVIRRMRRA